MRGGATAAVLTLTITLNPNLILTLMRAFSERTTTILKVTYSGFHFRSDGMSWLRISTPAIVPVHPTQYFRPYWNRLPRLRAAQRSRSVTCYSLAWRGVRWHAMPIPQRVGRCRRMMFEPHM